jgi:hypothetical protein
MTDGSMRASDTEREHVVSLLRDAYSEGRITLDEFTERTADAYAARTWDDLRSLTTDLPVEPKLGTAVKQVTDAEAQPVPAEPMLPLQQHHALPDRSGRRPRPVGLLLPVVLIWAVIAAANSNPAAAAVLAVVFLCLLTMRIAGSGRQ